MRHNAALPTARNAESADVRHLCLAAGPARLNRGCTDSTLEEAATSGVWPDLRGHLTRPPLRLPRHRDRAQ